MKLWQMILGVVGVTIVTEAGIKLGCRAAEKINNTRIRIKNSKKEKEGN